MRRFVEQARDHLRRWSVEIAIVAIGVALAVATLTSTSPTADEAKHIRNGFSFQVRGHGIHDETPSAMLHSILIDREALAGRDPTKGLWAEDDAFQILGRARIFTAVAFLGLLVVVARWAHGLFPRAAARVVLALAATSPTLLAHASLATSDMFLTVTSFTACHSLFRYHHAPSHRHAISIGAWTGLALLAKISGVFLYGTIVVVFGWLVLRAREEKRRTRVGRFAIVIVAPLLALNIGYRFEGTLQPMQSHALESEALRGVASSALGVVPVPIPAGFVHAIDYSLADRWRRLDREGLPAFMLGEAYVGTRSSYFPFAFLVKTSGVLLGLFALGIWTARRQPPPAALALGAFPIVFLLTNVLLNPFDIGIRYLLPIYPFVIVWCGFGIARGVGARIAVPAVAIQFLWTLVAFPNYLASFNFVSWLVPKDYLLSDSNLDWGQMNHRVTDDLDEHPTTAPVRLCTIGPVVGKSHRPEYACPGIAQEGRFYVSKTIERLGRVNFTPYLRHGPARTLAGVIDDYEITGEADFTVTFINDWEVSRPFPRPDPPEAIARMIRDELPFSPAVTKLGLLDVAARHGGAALPKTCVLARSAGPVTGEVLIGADDTMFVYDGPEIIARDTTRSGVNWPTTSVTFARPTQLRLMVCNSHGAFAVQAGIRP